MLCSYGCSKEALYQLKNGKWCCSKSSNGCSKVKERKKQPMVKISELRVCSYGCGNPAIYQFRNGKWCCSENHRKCEENKKQWSKLMINRWSNLAYKKKVSKRLTDYYSTPEIKQKHKEDMNKIEYKQKVRESRLKYYSDPENRKNHANDMRSPETRKKKSESKVKYYSDPKNREKAKEIQNREETIKKQKEIQTRLWKDPEHIKKIREGLNIRPNKPETIILNLLNEVSPNEWKYTGDFSFMINGKNPDFTNINGQKKLIELFGDYWHKGENPEDRKNIFREFGYETLVVWEHELKNIEEVKLKIIEFEKE
jgi:hypothetical protein